MCQHHKNGDQFYSGEKKYRLADYFNSWWEEYCKHPTAFIEPGQYKAVNAIRVCRTEVLGIDYYACPECGELSEVRHNCNHRFCPTCSWLDTVKWADRIKSQMLDIPHRHVVFTLPHCLNGLVKRNKKELLTILSRTAADTFKNWMINKYGIKPGIIGVIHTFGEKKNEHYHFHMILSWGGIDIKTGELVDITGKEKNYVKYYFLKDKFCNLFIDDLKELFDCGQLNHNFTNRREFMQFIKSLKEIKWQIHLEDPMSCPAAVVRYIARYSKRACLSEYKISSIEGEYISFTYKDYADRVDKADPKSEATEKTMRLHYNDFFPLLLQHVALPYFKLVKYYGCYGRFKKIPQEYKSKPEETNLSQQIEEEYQTSENNAKYCAACTCAKVYINTLLDKRLKNERNVPFDINKHTHLIYKKLMIEKKEAKIKVAA